MYPIPPGAIIAVVAPGIAIIVPRVTVVAPGIAIVTPGVAIIIPIVVIAPGIRRTLGEAERYYSAALRSFEFNLPGACLSAETEIIGAVKIVSRNLLEAAIQNSA